MTVPTPAAGQVARARQYLERVTAELPPRRTMSREYLTLLGHATALLSAIDAGAAVRPTPEVAARRVLAASVLADFDREASDFAAGGRVPDWLMWSHRLGSALGGVLGALSAAEPPPGGREAFQAAAIASSGVAPDGSARLSPADLLVVLGALDDAVSWATIVGGREADTVAYRRVSRALGDDR
jgi:hypothetical protein